MFLLCVYFVISLLQFYVSSAFYLVCVNVGLVIKGSCEWFMLSLAVRLRLFNVDGIVCCVCFISK